MIHKPNTLQSLLEKAVDINLLEFVADDKLIKLHQLCKSDISPSNYVSNQKVKWLPVVENEIRSRQELMKGGEGSRGGKIIGHTKSGKPIYNSFDHQGYKNFTVDEHIDAGSKHRDLANNVIQKYMDSMPSERTWSQIEEKFSKDKDWQHHDSQSKKHYDVFHESLNKKNKKSGEMHIVQSGSKLPDELGKHLSSEVREKLDKKIESTRGRGLNTLQDTIQKHLKAAGQHVEIGEGGDDHMVFIHHGKLKKSQETTENNLEKGGKRAHIGEIRIWGGQKVVKHQDGWVLLNEKTGKHQIEHPDGKRHSASPEHIEHAKKHLSEEVTTSKTPTSTEPFLPKSITDVRDFLRANNFDIPITFRQMLGRDSGEFELIVPDSRTEELVKLLTTLLGPDNWRDFVEEDPKTPWKKGGHIWSYRSSPLSYLKGFQVFSLEPTVSKEDQHKLENKEPEVIIEPVPSTLKTDVYYIEESVKDIDEDFGDNFGSSAVPLTELLDAGYDKKYLDHLVKEGHAFLYMEAGERGTYDKEAGTFESEGGSSSRVEESDIVVDSEETPTEPVTKYPKDEWNNTLISIKNQDWKVDIKKNSDLTDSELDFISDKLNSGYVSRLNLPEDNTKVEMVPGEEYSLSQFNQSVRKTTSDKAKETFIKEAKQNIRPQGNNYHDSESSKFQQEQEISNLVLAVGSNYGVYNYFNKNYPPTDITVKEMASITEPVESSNIYSRMAAKQYTVKEISFKVKVKFTAEPVTVKTKVLVNSTLNMRDIANFM